MRVGEGVEIDRVLSCTGMNHMQSITGDSKRALMLVLDRILKRSLEFPVVRGVGTWQQQTGTTSYFNETVICCSGVIR